MTPRRLVALALTALLTARCGRSTSDPSGASCAAPARAPVAVVVSAPSPADSGHPGESAQYARALDEAIASLYRQHEHR